MVELKFLLMSACREWSKTKLLSGNINTALLATDYQIFTHQHIFKVENISCH